MQTMHTKVILVLGLFIIYIGQDFSDVVLEPALQGLDTYIYTQRMHTNVKRLGYISFRVCINIGQDFCDIGLKQ